MQIEKFPFWNNKKFKVTDLFRNGEQGVWYDPSDISRYTEIGPELVSNGTFDIGITGWTARRSAVLSHSNGRLRVTNGGGVTSGLADTPITCEIGKTYFYKMTIADVSPGRIAFVRIADKNGQIATVSDFRVSIQALGPGTYTGIFVATQTEHFFFAQVDGGVDGNWVEFDNFSIKILENATMFQDSAGTTPVTGVEQPVGLMLDKSRGLALGSELISNGTFDNDTTGWAQIIGTISSVGGRLRVARSSDNIGRASAPMTCTIGKTYKCSVDRFIGTTPTAMIRITNSFNSVASGIIYELSSTSGGNLTFYFTATQTTHWIFCECGSGTVGQYSEFDNITVKELASNIAFQTTAIDRPILRNRYNMLTKTEQFNDAIWLKSNDTVTANAIIAPDGTLTADLNTEGTLNNAILQQTITVTAGVLNRASVYLKRGNTDVLRVLVFEVANPGNQSRLWINFATGTVTKTNLQGTGFTIANATMTTENNGFFRVSFDFSSATATSLRFGFCSAIDDNTTTRVDNATYYAWGASVTPTNQSHLPYQRVDTATVYDSDFAKFPVYLACNGTNTWMRTNNISFTGNDEMNVFSSARKLGVVGVNNILYETSEVSSVGNPGSFRLLAPSTAAQYNSRTVGTSEGEALTNNAIYVSPFTGVVTSLSKISDGNNTLRINGAQAVNITNNFGTGNFGNYPLYLFRRAGTSLPFNGNFYGLIIRGKLSNAKEIRGAEKLLAKNTGITI